MKKTVLVTGASHGIGRATAALFAEKGYNVAVNYNSSPEAAESLVSELIAKGFSAMAVKANVAIRAEVEKIFEEINKAWGDVHVLVNNAGIESQKLLTDVTEAEWDRIFDVNVKGIFNCTQVALKSMIRNHYGKIINISSILGISGSSCEVPYSASKAAVIGFTKALAKEVGPCSINVNTVAPGVIDTKMNQHIAPEIMNRLKEQTPLGTIGTCEDIAEAVLFLASDRSKFITGQVLSPNGGFVI
jgi:3-oxoacyl-[acyl-carrier protein] reductase